MIECILEGGNLLHGQDFMRERMYDFHFPLPYKLIFESSALKKYFIKDKRWGMIANERGTVLR
ncbi:hypothetical protein [Bacteroides pyogenes]|uniref:hypothetical protein n=1 Tax=Bacteroides pyogenes TaxID=310300 RepID=UPI001652F2A7|nr:hypothetical protein [Bacteroides pyogenes]